MGIPGWGRFDSLTAIMRSSAQIRRRSAFTHAHLHYPNSAALADLMRRELLGSASPQDTSAVAAGKPNTTHCGVHSGQARQAGVLDLLRFRAGQMRAKTSGRDPALAPTAEAKGIADMDLDGLIAAFGTTTSRTVKSRHRGQRSSRPQ